MRTLITLAIATTLTFLAGCNTVQGVGQDIKKAGSVLENAAKK
jgi:predicted small secreted protein